MDTEQPLVEARDLRTWFRTTRGTVRAVDGVSVTLERGRTVAIVGESGSGKTVLSRSIMGLVPQRHVVRSGQVLFRGQDITSWPRKQLRHLWGREMAMVMQNPMTSLNPVLRIGKQLEETLRLHLAIGRAEATQRAEELLRSVGIPEPRRRLRDYPEQLSGGMRQRVTIALALACDPALLIADEPTTALDVTIQGQILDLLTDQQAAREMALVLITHDLGVVAGCADEVVVMYAGRVVEQAPTAVLFSRPKMPYTKALLESIPSIDAPSHAPLRAIPGRPPALIDPPAGCRFAPRCEYVQDRCRQEEPPLEAMDGDLHRSRCWFPVPDPVAAGSRSAGAVVDGR